MSANSGILPLNKFKRGAKGKIAHLTATGNLRRRLLDMGLVPGSEITVEGRAPLGDPIEVSVRGYHLTLRQEEAATIFLEEL